MLATIARQLSVAQTLAGTQPLAALLSSRQQLRDAEPASLQQIRQIFGDEPPRVTRSALKQLRAETLRALLDKLKANSKGPKPVLVDRLLLIIGAESELGKQLAAEAAAAQQQGGRKSSNRRYRIMDAALSDAEFDVSKRPWDPVARVNLAAAQQGRGLLGLLGFDAAKPMITALWAALGANMAARQASMPEMAAAPSSEAKPRGLAALGPGLSSVAAPSAPADGGAVGRVGARHPRGRRRRDSRRLLGRTDLHLPFLLTVGTAIPCTVQTCWKRARRELMVACKLP
ncbi:hypothetical protein ABPG75_011464 [Micractinium tetrahymenae]